MILAPMQGLTEVLMRRVYEECFPGAFQTAVAPFISLTHGPLNNLTKMADVMPDNNRGAMSVVPQILGKEPDEFVQVAERLSEWGYREVNWNMGCPMRMVAAKHRGSGLLPYPDEVRAILDRVVPRLSMALSVKVRLGLKSSDEIFKIVEVLNDYPIQSVTIHPRLGRQQYTGVPDMDTFGQVLPLVKHPVVYNGDICTRNDAIRIRTKYPQVADLMIGRGVFYRPTLPLEIASNSNAAESYPPAARHFIGRLMEEIDRCIPSEESRIRKKKEYWCLLWKSLPISEIQARGVLRERNLQAVDNLIAKYTQ